jgi:coenzyme PQQ biosynthesis protein C
MLEAIASSLTEMFSPMIIAERVSGMLRHYDFVSEDTLRYFGHRLTQAPRDADFALDYVKRHATTPGAQEAALNALRFKCGMLWAQLDAIMHVYVNGNACPGAWRPGDALADAAA